MLSPASKEIVEIWGRNDKSKKKKLLRSDVNIVIIPQGNSESCYPLREINICIMKLYNSIISYDKIGCWVDSYVARTTLHARIGFQMKLIDRKTFGVANYNDAEINLSQMKDYSVTVHVMQMTQSYLKSNINITCSLCSMVYRSSLSLDLPEAIHSTLRQM